MVVTPSRAGFGEVAGRRSPGRDRAKDHHGERHGGSGRRDLEFLARGLRFARVLGHPAEEPQVDAQDRDAQATRDERVPELVQDQGAEVTKRPATATT